LKYKYEGHIHIVLANLKPYVSYNFTNLEIEGLDMYHVNLFDVTLREVQSTLIKANKEVQIIEIGMGTYKI